MGIKVKAMERNVAFDKKNEKWMFVMQPELYGQLAEDKVVEQAALASGLPKGVLQAALAAYGNVVKVWATEGHSIPIPGLGSMRFGLRSTAVDDVNKVSAQLITSRRVIFVPSVGIKQALADTGVNITCYDRNGKVIKSVTSDDKSEVEDPDNTGGSDNPGSGDNNPGGGTSGGGSSTGGSGSAGGSDGSGDVSL